MKRKVKITVTDMNGVLLDSSVIELEDKTWGLGIIDLEKGNLGHPLTTAELILGDYKVEEETLKDVRWV